MSVDFKEKRKMDRFSLELPAWISVRDESEKQTTLEVITSNICAGGAFFKMEKPFSVGTDVNINMILSFDKNKEIGGKKSQIDVSGSVSRRENNGVAVIFNKRYQISPIKTQ